MYICIYDLPLKVKTLISESILVHEAHAQGFNFSNNEGKNSNRNKDSNREPQQ
jgi:hypothetical protein